MLENAVFAVVMGSILGFLSGLGVGGGSLLILWLTLVLKMDYATARSINLLFFLPSALIACLFRWKQGCLSAKGLPLAMIVGSIAAALVTFFSKQWELSLLKKLFGGLLLLTGIRELLYRQKTEELH